MQSTDDLGNGPWQDLRIVCAQSYNRLEQVADATQGRSRFYRVAVDQQPGAPLKIRLLDMPFARTLSFSAVSNKTYTVQYTDRLGAGPWLKLVDLPAQPVNRVETLMDPDWKTNRFYRVITPRQP